MSERFVFHRIGAIDRNGEIGFSYAQYSLKHIRNNLSKLIGYDVENRNNLSKLIGYDVENYPLKIYIEKCRNLKCFGVDATYKIG